MFTRSFILACVLASAAADPTKSPSSGLHKPTWKPSSKPAEHRQLAGTPTKSPSSGLHKPTWKPSSKPAEHRTLSTRDERAATKATSSSAFDKSDALKEIKVEAKAAKTSLKKATTKVDKKEAEFEVDQASAMEKAVKAGQAVLVEDPKAAAKTATSATKKYLVYNMDMESPHLNRALEKKGDDKKDADPCHDGLSPRCTPPTSKPVEHRSLAGSPTKSPSSGLHKPTWKPSSKPNEHRTLKQDFLQTTAILKSPEESLSAENLEATKIHAANAQANAAKGGKDEGISFKPVLAAQQQTTVYAVMAEEKAAVAGEQDAAPSAALYATGGKVTTKKDADPCHDGLSPRCTPPTSKPAEHRSLAGSPTKSPSSGLHKPTWKPSSKPNEHRKLSIRSEKAELLAAKTASSKKTVEDKIVIKALKSEVKDDKELLSEVDTKSEKKELKSAIKADKKALEVDTSSKATTSLKSDIADLTKDIKSKAALKSLTITKSVKDLGETPPPSGSKIGQVDQKESKVDEAKEAKAAIKAEEKLEEKKAEEAEEKKAEKKSAEKSEKKEEKTSSKTSKTSKKAEQEVTPKTSLRQSKTTTSKSDK